MGMKDIRIEKITLNMGCGTKINPETAKTILENVSNCKAVITSTRKRSTFGVAKGKAIGCKVTVRKNIDEFLRKLLGAKEFELSASNFDDTGNLSFGIKEYIDIPGAEYDPKIGILGMDVCVTLERPGYRVKRKKNFSRIGKKHLIKKDEAMNFMKEKFGVKVKD